MCVCCLESFSIHICSYKLHTHEYIVRSGRHQCCCCTVPNELRVDTQLSGDEQNKQMLVRHISILATLGFNYNIVSDELDTYVVG